MKIFNYGVRFLILYITSLVYWLFAFGLAVVLNGLTGTPYLINIIMLQVSIYQTGMGFLGLGTFTSQYIFLLGPLSTAILLFLFSLIFDLRKNPSK